MASFAALALVADRFEVLRPLGAGGLAEVYAARDTATQQEVAIKILHAHLAHDEKLAERFRREMAVARGLDHPGIVRVFDLYQHRDGTGRIRPLLSMELLRGRTLAERMEKGRVPREEAFALVRSIAEALRSAHRAGVVHRDLKPANIFLCEGGGVKLLDFGSARAAGWVRLTAQSTLLGTPSFMAPELFAGMGADARADLYSLGATLFELLTSKQAFAGGDPFALLRLKGGPAPSPRAVDPTISEADDRLVTRALEPDPEKRFLDAGQFLRALDGLMTPAALAPPPAMLAGEVDVLLHGGGGARVARVLDACGAPSPPSGWRTRLRTMGRATLVSGVSRATAETMAALCQEQGLAVALEPTRAPGRLQPILRRFALAIGAVGGTTMGAAGAALASTILQARTTTGDLGAAAVIGGTSLIAALAVGLAGWGLAGGGSTPAMKRPDSSDPAVWRLREGIARRVLRIRALADRPGPLAGVMDELVRTAERLRADAEHLAAGASAVPDPLASADPEGITLPPGALEKRDAAVERLLEIASALDEALALIEAPKTEEDGRAALRRLIEETAFAEQVLPELRAAREAVG